MPPKPPRTRHVSSAEASSYLDKAKEFEEAMLENLRASRWDAAALAGIHAAISGTDALLGKLAGQRSAGEDHAMVLDLLKAKLLARVERKNLDEQIRRLSRILGIKNLVEYESRRYSEVDSHALAKDVSRYLAWVKSLFA